jgi:hypothetical protein
MSTSKQAATRFSSNNNIKQPGIFKSTGIMLGSGLNTATSLFETIDTGAQIALAATRMALAETIAEGVSDLVNLGYTEEEALEILSK